jgi:hypothetical protein
LLRSIFSDLVVDGKEVGTVRGTIDTKATGAHTTLLIDLKIDNLPRWNMIELYHPDYSICRLNSLRVGPENPAEGQEDTDDDEEMPVGYPVEWIGIRNISFLQEYHCTAGALSTGTLLTLVQLAPALKDLAFIHSGTTDSLLNRSNPLQLLENLRHLKLWSNAGNTLCDLVAAPGLNLPKLETLQLHCSIRLEAGTILEAVKAKKATRTRVAVMSTLVPTKVIYPNLRSLDIWITDMPIANHVSFALQVAAMVRPGCAVTFKLQTGSEKAQEWCEQAMIGLRVFREVTSGKVGWRAVDNRRKRLAEGVS